MDYSSKTIVDKMKHKMKKQFKKIEEKMEDYEKYKMNYEYFKYSPYVQELLAEIADLKRVNKVLMNELTIKDKSDREINKVRKHKPVIVKLEPIPGNGEVIDLTQDSDQDEVEDQDEVDDVNIVYDLEEVEGDDDVIDLSQEELEEEVEADEEEVDEEDEEDQDAVETEDQEEAEDEEAEEEAEEEEVEEEDEEEEVEEDVEAEDQDAVEEEEVYEIKIKNKTYYTTNEKNGTIYSVDKDGDIGDEVGQYVDGKPVFKK